MVYGPIRKADRAVAIDRELRVQVTCGYVQYPACLAFSLLRKLFSASPICGWSASIAGTLAS
jgi:hypothetical protein